jgi:(p)ppGpp synthase/HD superfamily hydrolase
VTVTFSPTAYVDALHFAAAAHRDQRFPGKDLPYLVHVVAVAAEVIAALPDEAPDRPDLAVQCALLHDTVEDTDASLDELAARFGPDVAAGVDALSKRASLPKDRQMDDSIDRILAQPREIALVKLADRITNLAEPPPYWTVEKRSAYRAEAEHLVARLGGSSRRLADRLRARIVEYRAWCGP